MMLHVQGTVRYMFRYALAGEGLKKDLFITKVFKKLVLISFCNRLAYCKNQIRNRFHMIFSFLYAKLFL